jgi:hypothetical protein
VINTSFFDMEPQSSLSKLDEEAWRVMEMTAPLPGSDSEVDDELESMDKFPSSEIQKDYYSDIDLSKLSSGAIDQAIIGHEDSHILPGIQLSTKVANAEQRLLRALSKDRFFSSSNPIKRATVAGVDMDNLDSLRIHPEAALEREVLAEREMMAAMDQSKPEVPWDPRSFPLIEESKHHRKARHDEGLKKYKNTVVVVADSLEDRVVQSCYNLRELQIDQDAKLQLIFDKLNIDDDLRERDREYVLQTWNTIALKLEERKQAVEHFGSLIKGIEEERSTRIKQAVATLIDDLVGVSYLLRPEIQRLVEAETNLANNVIITNLQAASDCTARLRRMHVEVGVQRRAQWEIRERDWRKLRHDDAITRFHTIIDSNEYRNPMPRQKVLSQFRERQSERHTNTRLPLLNKLGSLTVPPNLSTSAVKEILDKFEDLNQVEIKNMESLIVEDLAACSTNLLFHAEELQEALRMELHYFGALAEKPNLLSVSTSMSDASGIIAGSAGIVEDEELADFFRRSGNLKNTLKKIIEGMRKPTLVYQKEAKSVLRLVMSLRASINIGEILEAQGKGADRNSIQSTLEKLRTGKSSDVGKNSKTLLRKLRSFATVTGLDPLFMSELNSIVDGLAGIFEPNDKKKAKGRNNAINPQEHLSELRALQRRAGSLIYACDLTVEIKNSLDNANLSLRQQIYANSKIDAVISKECNKKNKKRVKEDKKIVSRIKKFLKKQIGMLAEVPQNICKFYSFIANESEKNVLNIQNLDDTFEDDLVDLLDNYDADHEAKEEKLKQQLHNLRYARNSEILNKSFDLVVATLQSIENEYRDHGATFVKRADRYPIDASGMHSKYSIKICEHLGVIAPEIVKSAKEKFENESNSVKDGTQETDSSTVIADDSKDEDSKSQNSIDVSESNLETDQSENISAEDGVTENAEENEENNDDDTDEQLEMEDNIRDEVAAENDEQDDLEAEEGDGHNEDGETEENEKGTHNEISDEGDKIPPPPAKGSWQEFQTFKQLTLGRTLFVVRTPAIELAKTLIGKHICEEANIFSDPPQQITLSEEEQEKEDEMTLEEKKEREESIAASKLLIKWPAKLPYDIEGNPTCQVVVFTVAQLTGILTDMRDSFLSLTSENWTNRIISVTKIAKRHRRKSLFDLEERLRLHWPRKGNADVMYMQPRIGEISAHRKRLERQKRNVMQRHATHNKKVQVIVNTSNEQIKLFISQLQTLTDMLKTQSSLAGLQGVMKRCKDSVKEFDEKCSAIMKELHPYVDSEPRQLVESNARFISTCLTYEDDGDYDVEEVDICKSALNKIDKKCALDVEERVNTISNLSPEHQNTRNNFSIFEKKYMLAVKDLSMREGVGKKYGQPRRKFLESIRTISTFTERAKQKLDNAILVTSNVCQMEAGDVIGKPGVAPQMDTITRELLYQMLFVRSEFCSRVNYMNALTPNTELLESKPVMLSTDQDDIMLECEENNESKELFVGKKFDEQIVSFKEECGKATKLIYENEGKMDEVGEDGVPEKLRTYLDKKTKEAMVFGRETTKQFRSQVEKFQEKFVEVPKALYRDVAARAKRIMLKHISNIERDFIALNDESEARRGLHKMELRPELASPNYAVELNKLSNNEKDRSLKLCISIIETEREVLLAIEKSSLEFMNEMVEVTKSLLHLLDTTVAPWDIRDMRTASEIELEASLKKRASLKTLRKLRFKEQSGKTIPTGTIVEKDWLPLPSGELHIKKYLPKEQPEEKLIVAQAKLAAKKAAIEAGEDIEEDDEDEGEDLGEDPEVEEKEVIPGETITSRTTTASRSAIRWRDRVYQEYLKHFHHMCSMYKMRFEKLLEEERTWAQNWNKMCSVLQAKSREGGIL